MGGQSPIGTPDNNLSLSKCSSVDPDPIVMVEHRKKVDEMTTEVMTLKEQLLVATSEVEKAKAKLSECDTEASKMKDEYEEKLE
mmetsp:Transcript_14794/g.22945  ORF Transcript_14794/g.22945 Transcript_14794/m.22945 type:complete len:84 (+) Transcript_14794:1064-1315(+)